jgi:hypothetical protein
MALVEVGRFLAIEEVQVAASALRAAGVHVVLANDILGAMDINLLYALGGVRLLTLEEDAADVRAYLAECRRQPSEMVPLPQAEAGLRALVSLALTLATGFIVPLRRRNRSWRDGRALDG